MKDAMQMITVTHKSSKSSSSFYDSEFTLTGVPMTNYNTIVIHKALNDKASMFGDEAFTPKPDGSSYTITVRGLTSQSIFNDVKALQIYILEKIKSCEENLKQRNS